MTLQFILGRAGSGKTRLCIEQINQELHKDLLSSPLIMLVPEQASYQTETALAQASGLGGTLRVQVLSFKRLGWRILTETGGQQEVLGELGKRMILRRILLRHRHSLKAFARIAERPGLADQLAQSFREFKLYRITPEDFKDLSLQNELLNNKIQDTAFLYESYQTLLGDRIDTDDELNYVAEKIEKSYSIRNSMIWVDGFTGFTFQELYILEKLLLITSKMVITLPLDEDFISNHQNRRLGEEFFSIAEETYSSLKRLAYSHGIKIKENIYLKQKLRFSQAIFKHLEDQLYKYPTLPFPLVTSEEKKTPLQIAAAVNSYSEIEEVAREIWSLVRDGYRWGDLAILSRDLENYQDLIGKLFLQYEIPYFLDSKHFITQHPLIELILAAIEVVESNWSYEGLFRCVKTGFFNIDKDCLDRLENYCLENGISAKDWQASANWIFPKGTKEIPKIIQAKMTQAKKIIQDLFLPLASSFNSNQMSLVRNVTDVLYQFLTVLDVPSVLKKWAAEAQQRGNIIEAQIHEQIWNEVIDIFDQIVLGLGDETIPLSDYASILQMGLESMKLGAIPMGQDQVSIGSLERSRNPEVKAIFIIGVNEGILPRRPETMGVFSEKEREILIAHGLEIPSERIQIYQEQFFIYTALTRATEKIYLSYPLTDGEGKPLEPSPLIHRLLTLFPGLNERFYNPSQETLRIVCRPKPLIPLYAAQLQKLKEGKALSKFWNELELALLADSETEQSLRSIKEALGQVNQEVNVPRELTRRLYGKQLRLSVSRLEEFSRCPFAHFVRHGLKLKERKHYQVNYPDLGNFFHQILRSFAHEVNLRGLKWGELSWNESWTLIGELTERVAPDIQNKVLLSSARYRYLTRKLKRTAHYAVRVLGEHARKGVFSPIHLEVKFGPEETIPGRMIPLSMGESLILSGQIDRIDSMSLGNKIYLRIVDYKSSEMSLNLDTIYHGLSLQLLTYLDIALHGALIEVPTGTSIVPAGILYFPVLEPNLTETSPLPLDAINELKLKSVKVKGYFLAEQTILESMDYDLRNGDSPLLGIKLTSNQEFRKDAPLLKAQDFAMLRNYLNLVLAQKGEAMFDGDVSIAPYRYGQKTGCDYCPFKAVCKFDANLHENKFRNLPKLKDHEVLERLERIDVPEESSSSEVIWLDDLKRESGEGH